MTDQASASAPAPSVGRRLSQLETIWRFVKRYPGHLTVAAISLLAASGATLAIPQGFRFVVDNAKLVDEKPADGAAPEKKPAKKAARKPAAAKKEAAPAAE